MAGLPWTESTGGSW